MIIYTQYSLSNVPCYKDFLHRHLKNRRDIWEGGKNMERKTRLLPYILVTALCLVIALGASAGYRAVERLNRRYYTLVVYLAALRVALPALFGVALYFWQRVGRRILAALNELKKQELQTNHIVCHTFHSLYTDAVDYYIYALRRIII